jgi:HPt (histidine-containing phosphotransfer) domain-containing protein
MTKIYDHDGSMLRMGHDQQLFHEMVELLKSDAPKHLAAARRSHQDEDWPRLERAAHTLKGLAANFGAARAVTAAADLERLAKSTANRSPDGALVDGALDEIHDAFEQLMAGLPRGAAASSQSAAPTGRGARHGVES